MTSVYPTLFPLAWLAAAALPAQAAPPTTPSPQLGEGTLLQAGSHPMDVTVGHAAPNVFDIDGDGVRDLLVGEFGTGKFADDRLPASTLEKWGPRSFASGKLRVYKNHGTNADPRFGDFEYLKAMDQHASVPTT